MGTSGEYRFPDILLFLAFVAITFFSMYICFNSLFVERRYVIFDTEEAVEEAHQLDLMRALVRLME